MSACPSLSLSVLLNVSLSLSQENHSLIDVNLSHNQFTDGACDSLGKGIGMFVRSFVEVMVQCTCTNVEVMVYSVHVAVLNMRIMILLSVDDLRPNSLSS